jgi:hypothetical protein
MKPRYYLASFVLALVLTACADRYRENCNTTKAEGLLERRCA